MRQEVESGLLVYARTQEPQFFHMAKAKNLAHRLATGEIVCNLDADNYATAEFTQHLLTLFSATEDIVTHGSGGNGFYGRVAVTRNWFYKLGGYDECLNEGWGYDDSDFVARAKKAGLKEKELPPQFGQAVDHSDVERTALMLPSQKIMSQTLGLGAPDISKKL